MPDNDLQTYHASHLHVYDLEYDKKTKKIVYSNNVKSYIPEESKHNNLNSPFQFHFFPFNFLHVVPSNKILNFLNIKKEDFAFDDHCCERAGSNTKLTNWSLYKGDQLFRQSCANVFTNVDNVTIEQKFFWKIVEDKAHPDRKTGIRVIVGYIGDFEKMFYAIISPNADEEFFIDSCYFCSFCYALGDGGTSGSVYRNSETNHLVIYNSGDGSSCVVIEHKGQNARAQLNE